MEYILRFSSCIQKQNKIHFVNAVLWPQDEPPIAKKKSCLKKYLMKLKMSSANSTGLDHQSLNIIVPLSFISLSIITANTAVCVLVYMKKSLRTYTNGFVCSLAVSDILTGGIVFPLHMAKPTSPLLEHIIGIVLSAGVANVAAVTFDRYLAVMNPLMYNSIIPKYFLKVVIMTWVLPVLLTLIPFAWGKSDTVLAQKIYVFSLEIFCVMVPYVCVFTAYCKIFHQVKKCVKKHNRELSLAKVRTGQKKLLASQSEVKVAMTFSLVALVFIGSWLPVLYITAVHTLERPELAPPLMRIFSLFTLALGSLANPLLYSFMKPDFKQTLKTLTCRKTNMFSTRHLSLSRFASADVFQKAKIHSSSSKSSPCTPSGTFKFSVKSCLRNSDLLLQTKSESDKDENGF